MSDGDENDESNTSTSLFTYPFFFHRTRKKTGKTLRCEDKGKQRCHRFSLMTNRAKNDRTTMRKERKRRTINQEGKRKREKNIEGAIPVFSHLLDKKKKEKNSEIYLCKSSTLDSHRSAMMLMLDRWIFLFIVACEFVFFSLEKQTKILLRLATSSFANEVKPNRFDPILSSTHYTGRLAENQRSLELEPRLTATDIDGTNSVNGWFEFENCFSSRFSTRFREFFFRSNLWL